MLKDGERLQGRQPTQTTPPQNHEPEADQLRTDVDEVIEGLFQQYQEQQAGPALKTPSRISRTALMYADGVRAGGFRQTAYSDSHQELVKSVQRISTEEIQILSSAQKKRSIEAAYQAQLESRNAPAKNETDELEPPVIPDDKAMDQKQTTNHKT